MASLISPPLDTVKFSSPKRARLSLKHHVGRPAQKAKLDIDSIDSKQENMIIEQDENLSPNCNVSEIMLSPYVCDNVINRNHKISALGLPNCGNTCYINSIVQVLRFTPNFSDILHSLIITQNQLTQIASDPSDIKPDEFLHKLHMVYISMKKQEEFIFKDREDDCTSLLQHHIESFAASLREVSTLFKEGEQHDAHEFLLTILSHFDDVSQKIKQVADDCSNHAKDLNKLGQSPSRDKRKLNKHEKYRLLSILIESGLLQKTSNCSLGFKGNMQHIVKCLECEKRSERLESFTNLEISIAKDLIVEETVDLHQCLIQRTTLSGNNKYFCEECFHSTEACIFSEIVSLPLVLVLHYSWLTQFSHLNEIEKDSTKIAIPLYIKASENLNVFRNATDETYYLYGIVFHIGTSGENGHYVSFIKEMPDFSEMLDCSLLNKLHWNDIRNCCAKENIFNTNSSHSVNNWLFFDDEDVLTVTLNDASVFPYYDFMTTSASPCIIFYYKK